MFRNIISTSPLTDDMSNPCFPHITGEAYQGDMSMVATLRALIAPRMEEGEKIHVCYRTCNYNKSDLNGYNAEQVANVVIQDPCPPDTIKVVGIRGDAEGIQISFDSLIDHLPTIGFEEMVRANAYFKASFNMRCFINGETRSVLLFVEALDVRKLHAIQMLVLPMLPWYFGRSKTPSETEMALVESLSKKEPDDYLSALGKIASGYDFRTPRIKNLLAGFETRFERIEKDRVKNVIESIDSNVADMERRIHDLLTQRRENEIRLYGLTCKLESTSGEDSMIMEYFLCNKRLFLRNTTDDYFEFIVGDYLTYFDPDMVERTINNRDSYFYSSSSGPSRDDMKRLLNAIFVDQTIKMRLYGCYRLYLDGTCEAVTVNRDELPADFMNYMPNTHINRYHCLGNNKEAIRKCCRAGNYIGAIEQCVASCKSMNIGDSTVMEKFTNDLLRGRDTNNNGFELPDGRLVNHTGAIEWLKEQEAARGKKEEEA